MAEVCDKALRAAVTSAIDDPVTVPMTTTVTDKTVGTLDDPCAT